jgi:prepilin-type N-terminal cleavage/methylation domain-containing protein
MRRPRAFTLIELLVVVGIIAVLVGMLLPTLNRAKQMARVAVCANNLRNIGVAWHLYLNENEDTFPQNKQGNMAWYYGGSQQCMATKTGDVN